MADGLKSIKEKTIFLTEEVNDIMSSMLDIVSLPKLDDLTGYMVPQLLSVYNPNMLMEKAVEKFSSQRLFNRNKNSTSSPRFSSL